MTTETTYTTTSGRVYVITRGIGERTWWATFERKPSGSLRRIVSKYLPWRETEREAQEDFAGWISYFMHRRGSAAGRDELRPVHEALLRHGRG